MSFLKVQKSSFGIKAPNKHCHARRGLYVLKRCILKIITSRSGGKHLEPALSYPQGPFGLGKIISKKQQVWLSPQAMNPPSQRREASTFWLWGGGSPPRIPEARSADILDGGSPIPTPPHPLARDGIGRLWGAKAIQYCACHQKQASRNT